jgi:D-sedoheptulose 7-phosphate isomerase
VTDFLYPFLEGDERDADALLRDLAVSASSKTQTSLDLQSSTIERQGSVLAAAAAAIAARVGNGGRILAFGNGGSATDASGIAALFANPPDGVAIAALDLAADPAVLTALGNDVGFDLVFSRQIIANGGPHDVAIGVSTSGTSRNVVGALEEARRRGMLTIGLAGYNGGAMADAQLDHCLVVRSDSVHRIQEAQAALVFALWSAVQAAMQPGGQDG